MLFVQLPKLERKQLWAVVKQMLGTYVKKC
jgi:hypothetical protein